MEEALLKLGVGIKGEEKRLLKDNVSQSLRSFYVEAATELKQSEERFQALLNLLPDPVVIIDGKGKFLAVNDRVEEKSGFKREELLGKNFLRTEIVAAESKAILMMNLAKRMMGMRIKPYEVEVLRKDGGKLIAEVNAAKIEYGGKPADIVIFRDITERRKAEREIRIKDSAIASSINAIAFADLEGNLTYVNPSFLKLWEYKNDKEVLGKPAVKFWHLEEKASEVVKVLRDEGSWTGELKAKKKDGSTFHVDLSANLVKDEVGKPICMMASFVDITERKKMEEKLRQYTGHLEELIQKRTEELLESEERCSVLAQEARDGMVVLQDEKIAFANKRLLEVIGYSIDEIIGMPFEKIVYEKYRQIAKERYTRRMRGEKVPATIEIEVIAKTGERVPIEANAALMHHQGRPADIVIVRDLREKKRMEEELSELEQLNRDLKLEKTRAQSLKE